MRQLIAYLRQVVSVSPSSRLASAFNAHPPPQEGSGCAKYSAEHTTFTKAAMTSGVKCNEATSAVPLPLTTVCCKRRLLCHNPINYLVHNPVPHNPRYTPIDQQRRIEQLPPIVHDYRLI